MVITNNDELAEKIRLLRSHGMTTLTLDRHKGHAYSYDVLEKGYNYRPTEMTAAIGLVQLRKLAQKNESRRSLVKLYRAMLSNEIPQVYIPFSRYSLKQAAPHIMPILLPKHVSRVKVMDFLKKNGIQTSIHYRPIHTFSAYIGSTSEFQLTLTNQIGESCLTLPLYPAMTPEDVETCVHTLRKALTG